MVLHLVVTVRWLGIALLVLGFIQAPAQAQFNRQGLGFSVPQVPVPPPPLTFTSLATGTVGGAPIAGSGAYTGTAPTGISSATWGSCGGGSSTVSSFSASTGTWSANFTVPGSSGVNCTISVTDSRSEIATSPATTIFPSGYNGPADIAGPAIAWYGLRSYSNAYATGSNNAFQITAHAGSNSGNLQNIVILSNGAFDIATANAFVGIDATGVGAITGTTLTFTGGHVGDTVTGGTTAAGTYIFSGVSPTWTVNISQTVVSATLTLQFGIYAAKGYDQTGNGNDALQAVSNLQPQILPTGGGVSNGTLPLLCFNTLGTNQNLTTSTSPTIGTAATFSTVAKRLAGFTSFNRIIVAGGSGGAYFDASTNNALAFQGATGVTRAATDSALHAMQFILTGTTGSFVNVDGTSGSTGNAGSTSLTGVISLSQLAGNPLQGCMEEAGVWAGNFNPTQISNMPINQLAAWP